MKKTNQPISEDAKSSSISKSLVALIVIAVAVVGVGVGLFIKIQNDQNKAIALNEAGFPVNGETIPSEYLDAAHAIVESRVTTPPLRDYSLTIPSDGDMEFEFKDSYGYGAIDYIGSSDIYEHVIGTGNTYIHYKMVMTLSDVYALNIGTASFVFNDTSRSGDVKIRVNDGDWVNPSECADLQSGDVVEVLIYTDKIDDVFTIYWASPDGTQTATIVPETVAGPSNEAAEPNETSTTETAESTEGDEG